MEDSGSCTEAACGKDELGPFMAVRRRADHPSYFVNFTATDGVTERAYRAVASKRASDSEGISLPIVGPGTSKRWASQLFNSRKPVARPWPPASSLIGWIRKLAFVDRKTSASDASGEPCSETLELSDPSVDPFRPLA